MQRKAIPELLNKKYYNGWSTVSPQRLFNVSIGAEYRF